VVWLPGLVRLVLLVAAAGQVGRSFQVFLAGWAATALLDDAPAGRSGPRIWTPGTFHPQFP